MARRLSTVLIAAAVAGTLQLGIALLLAAASGRGILPVLREMAASLFGEGLRTSGWGGATIGLVVHFVTIAIVVSVYVFTARRLEFPKAHPLLAGLAYGVLIGTLHALLVARGLPTLFPQVTAVDAFIALAAWMVCAGLPIGWMVARRMS